MIATWFVKTRASLRDTAVRLPWALGQGTSSAVGGLPGACGVVGRSDSLWEEGQWLPALMSGLSWRKPVSALRMVHFVLHCNYMKYQIGTLAVRDI